MKALWNRSNLRQQTEQSLQHTQTWAGFAGCWIPAARQLLTTAESNPWCSRALITPVPTLHSLSLLPSNSWANLGCSKWGDRLSIKALAVYINQHDTKTLSFWLRFLPTSWQVVCLSQAALLSCSNHSLPWTCQGRMGNDHPGVWKSAVFLFGCPWPLSHLFVCT